MEILLNIINDNSNRSRPSRLYSDDGDDGGGYGYLYPHRYSSPASLPFPLAPATESPPPPHISIPSAGHHLIPAAAAPNSCWIPDSSSHVGSMNPFDCYNAPLSCTPCSSYASGAAAAAAGSSSTSDGDSLSDLIDLVLLDPSPRDGIGALIRQPSAGTAAGAAVYKNIAAGCDFPTQQQQQKGVDHIAVIVDGTLDGTHHRSLQLPDGGSSFPAHVLSVPPPPPSSDTMDLAAACNVHIFRDSNREFGLNPILGSPLVVAAKEEMDYNEICLVHLLMSAAEAVAGKEADLASVILVRLREFAACAGGSMRSTVQRVAAYFGEGLKACGGGGAAASTSAAEILAAFQILQVSSPYMKFAHFTANQAILEATEGHRSIHVVDFDIMEGIQWPPLMQAMAASTHRPPAQLRITALYRPPAELEEESNYNGRHGFSNPHETGKRLADFASQLGLPFRLNLIPVVGSAGIGNTDDEFGVAFASIDVRHGEALVVNCMLHLLHMPHKSAAAVRRFLRAAHQQLRPRLLTVVEEDLGSATTTAAVFLKDAIRHYSAICDSLEDCLPSQAAADGAQLVERVFIAPRIERMVRHWSGLPPVSAAAAGGAATGKWSEVVRGAGFKERGLSSENLSQARMLVGMHREGFTAEVEEGGGRLVLGWRNQRLFVASTWETAAD